MFDTWDDPQVATFWVATIAIAIALSSLLWQLYYATRIDRARLKVTATEGSIWVGHSRMPVIVMTVTNVGRRATLVNNLLLGLGRRPLKRGPLEKVWKQNVRIAAKADEILRQFSTSFPKRLEPGDEGHLYVPLKKVADMLSAAGLDHAKSVYGVSHATTARPKRSRNLKIKREANGPAANVETGPQSGG